MNIAKVSLSFESSPFDAVYSLQLLVTSGFKKQLILSCFKMQKWYLPKITWPLPLSHLSLVITTLPDVSLSSHLPFSNISPFVQETLFGVTHSPFFGLRGWKLNENYVVLALLSVPLHHLSGTPLGEWAEGEWLGAGVLFPGHILWLMSLKT